jgi:hypothetical protein
MTPVEKAQDLLHNYEVQVRFSMEDCSFTYRDSDYSLAIKRTAKQCALIAVNEMIEYENRMLEEWTRYFEGKGGQMKIERLFWEEVKQEIEYMYTKQLPK